jgi:hypothetical protein
MDDTKKKRLAALKAETAENVTKPPRKQKEKLDLWDELSLNPPVIAEKLRKAIPPTPIEAAPIPKLAAIAPTISPKPEAVKQEPTAPVIDRIKLYGWPEGYRLASGKPISGDDPQYANAGRFKIFHPPNLWIARTEDRTGREYEITVECDVWDGAQLMRVNRVLSHSPTPSVVNPYTGFRE